jgi:lipopolysaccharide transport system ATP-binding protein
MSEIAIRVEGLSKKYRIGTRSTKYSTLRDAIARGVTRPFKGLGSRTGADGATQNGNGNTIWALKDVSFEIKRGDVVGLIGANGSGKSTLLKILTRITDPTNGTAELRGRVSSLLEVGTGFHPELTGRDNLYLNGTILGMKKSEIDRKFDEIVAFSEVEQFIDTPVKHYSSGMYLRLAFSVAAHLDPEILLVDEVLAVGDASFQRKCLGKIGDISEQGRTAVFVSHNMAAVEYLCHKGIALEKGKLTFDGTAKEAVNHYLHSLVGGGRTCDSHGIDLSDHPGRRARLKPMLQRLELFTDGDIPVNGGMHMGASLKARIHFNLDNPTSVVDAGLSFDSLLGQRIFSAHSRYEPNRSKGSWIGDNIFVCEIPSLTLVPGEYKIKVALDVDHVPGDTIEDATRLTVVESDYYGTGRIPEKGLFVLKHNWYLE